MPTEHIRFSYTFDELADDAKTKAIAAVADKLGGDWWDDNDAVADSIVYRFAQKIGNPDVEGFGEGDFSGIDRIKLVGWSCGHVQGDYVGFTGTLNRENAPSLPWVDGIDHITLEERRSYTSIWFAMDQEDDASQPESSDCETMRLVIREAFHAALQAGYDVVDYIGSEENAGEWIEGNAPEFNEDGTLF